MFEVFVDWSGPFARWRVAKQLKYSDCIEDTRSGKYAFFSCETFEFKDVGEYVHLVLDGSVVAVREKFSWE